MFSETSIFFNKKEFECRSIEETLNIISVEMKFVFQI